MCALQVYTTLHHHYTAEELAVLFSWLANELDARLVVGAVLAS